MQNRLNKIAVSGANTGETYSLASAPASPQTSLSTWAHRPATSPPFATTSFVTINSANGHRALLRIQRTVSNHILYHRRSVDTPCCSEYGPSTMPSPKYWARSVMPNPRSPAKGRAYGLGRERNWLSSEPPEFPTARPKRSTAPANPYPGSPANYEFSTLQIPTLTRCVTTGHTGKAIRPCLIPRAE